MASYFVERAPRKQSFLGRDRVAYTQKQTSTYESKLSTSSFLLLARTTCNAKIFGVDALMGHTRSHPEHDG